MPPFAAPALLAAPSDYDASLDEEDTTAETRRVEPEDDDRTARRAKLDDGPARPMTTTASATLPVGADAAFRAFGDAAETPRWLPVLHAARVLDRDDRGRATRVAFVGRLERGSIGYTLEYRFDDDELAITWRTAIDAAVQVRGQATFAPLSAQACLMTYSVSIDAPVGPWSDPSFEHHPASSVVTSFREHLRRDR